jgi:hypothetical protein
MQPAHKPSGMKANCLGFSCLIACYENEYQVSHITCFTRNLGTMQAMLSENWASRAAADAEAPTSSTGEAAAPPAFNPAAPEYNVSGLKAACALQTASPGFILCFMAKQLYRSWRRRTSSRLNLLPADVISTLVSQLAT